MQAPYAPLLPPDLQQALRMALEYRKGGRPAEAAALYRQQLAVYPRQPELLGHFADLLLSQGDFPAALPLVEQARAVAPGQARFWLMQAQCLLQLGRAKDARKLITEAIGKGLRHPLADELLRQARAG
ncbi:MAG TPA: tetratricopeptide repeat protein, partial [Thiobacillus sp.]|nr:tetratricopeptide repeat protein [Thiobacillus sp.]